MKKYNIKNNKLKSLLIGLGIAGLTFGGTSCGDKGEDPKPTPSPIPTVQRTIYVDFADTEYSVSAEIFYDYLQTLSDSAAKDDIKNVLLKPVGSHDRAGAVNWEEFTNELEVLNNKSNGKIMGSKADTLKVDINKISELDEQRLTALNFTVRDYFGRQRQ